MCTDASKYCLDGSNGMFIQMVIREEREEDGMGVELPRGTSRTADPAF